MSNLEHWGHVDNKGRYSSELTKEKEHPWYAHAPDNEALDTLICWFDVAIFNLNRKIIKNPNYTTVHLKNGLDRTTSNISFTPSTLFCSSLKWKFHREFWKAWKRLGLPPPFENLLKFGLDVKVGPARPLQRGGCLFQSAWFYMRKVTVGWWWIILYEKSHDRLMMMFDHFQSAWWWLFYGNGDNHDS